MGDCVLLGEVGDPGWYIQAFLGAVSFSSLVAKRYWDRHRRTWSVWGMDAAKQAIGALFAHALNMAFASLQAVMLEGDACEWYWLNIMLDTTAGVAICYFALKMLLNSNIVHLYMGGSIVKYGYYGDPPQIHLWTKQMMLWLVVIFLMKMAVLAIMIVCQHLLLGIAQFFLAKVDTKPVLKLVVVMILTPVVMNSLQYWLTDNFLQHKHRSEDDDLLPLRSPSVGSTTADSPTSVTADISKSRLFAYPYVA